MLKQKLLATGYFIENSYFADYLKLITKSTAVANKYDEHHIIPLHYYQDKYNCTRQKAFKISLANNDPVVKLSLGDHCLAHWLLSRCSINSRGNLVAYICILKKVSANPSIHGLTLEEYQQLNSLDLDDFFWTQSEKDFIKNNYTKYSYKQLALLLGLPDSSTSRYIVRNLCRKLDCLRGRDDLWTEEKCDWLIENYHKGTSYCAAYLEKSESAIRTKSSRLNLKSSARWTKDQEQWLKENNTIHSDSYCAMFLNKTIKAIQCKKSRLNKENY